MPGTKVLKQNKNNTGNNLDNILMQKHNKNIYKVGINTEDYLQNLNSWLTPTKGGFLTLHQVDKKSRIWWLHNLQLWMWP